MSFNQFYLACLAHALYFIGDESPLRAVVFDPQPDVAQDDALGTLATHPVKRLDDRQAKALHVQSD